MHYRGGDLREGRRFALGRKPQCMERPEPRLKAVVHEVMVLLQTLAALAVAIVEVAAYLKRKKR
jgi:hypothetical protein